MCDNYNMNDYPPFIHSFYATKPSSLSTKNIISPSLTIDTKGEDLKFTDNSTTMHHQKSTVLQQQHSLYNSNDEEDGTNDERHCSFDNFTFLSNPSPSSPLSSLNVSPLNSITNNYIVAEDERDFEIEPLDIDHPSLYPMPVGCDYNE